MAKQYVCIHGHFYQPPRENAWLEYVEAQDSADPYHDWNLRITSECYAANAASRILDGDGYIIDVVNNYAEISFNFGPTLLSWMEKNARGVYEAILEADRVSAGRFNGHGSALAQPYNHMIMPLATRRDKITQIRWGIRDFEYRFGRAPEGMWLPETAVDMETLDIMSESGIAFTLLSPHQVEKVRWKDDGQWRDVTDTPIDCSRPYRIVLSSGRSMALFFYDPELSRAVAFERLPANGDAFYERVLERFRKDDVNPQLIHFCSDGETYGHHHLHGDMGLAYALHRFEEDDTVQLTNYGAFLEAHPPEDEVRIRENTSWSCIHGIERWRGDCGCSSGANPQWHQKWRTPLREALDWLRDILLPSCEAELGRYLKDPWQARDDYIDVILHRDSDAMDAFFHRNRRKMLSPSEQISVLKLMEIQRNCLLMYTSCGWFFDDVSGIETVQIMQYAGRALQLARVFSPPDLETGFLEKLALAPSNIPEHANGGKIYEKWIIPASVSLAEVGGHYAISSLFKTYGEQSHLYCYTVHRLAYDFRQAGQTRLAVGRVHVNSGVTWESAEFVFAVIHFGDHNIACGLAGVEEAKSYEKMRKEIFSVFDQADFPAVIQKIDHFFNAPLYSMKSLFRDEQRSILEPILQSRIADAISLYKAVYEPNVPLMRFLSGTNNLTPRALAVAGELVLNHRLRQELVKERLDHEQIRNMMEQARLARIPLNETILEYTLRNNIEGQVERFENHPAQFEVLDDLAVAVELVYALPFHVVLRKAQNAYFIVDGRFRERYSDRAAQGDPDAVRWLDRFDHLGEMLLVRPGTGRQQGA